MRSESDLSFVERARREQILHAAIELIAEGGYGAASLSSIATRIGASKGVISYHFAGKDELLGHLVTSVLSDAGAAMGPQVAAASGARAKMRAYVTSNLTYLATHRNEIRALTAVLANLPPGPGQRSAYSDFGRDAVDALAALLVAGQRAGEFRVVDAHVAARSLRASIDAVTELLGAEPNLDIDGYADDLLDLFEAGVLA